ncbi:uncharacterized protein LOC134541166 isoform X2 [Bacillus rossius redtenbacheri]|uniref:uncharacterized protein LOC134541166 isoform X2 n=1 Tax=Bacillus rossius redtenbacheri TaxID=93214 RepID=UPI002FDD634D
MVMSNMPPSVAVATGPGGRRGLADLRESSSSLLCRRRHRPSISSRNTTVTASLAVTVSNSFCTILPSPQRPSLRLSHQLLRPVSVCLSGSES